MALLRRSEPRGAPAGELRGAVEAYSVLRGEIVVQLRDAELVVPGHCKASDEFELLISKRPTQGRPAS